MHNFLYLIQDKLDINTDIYKIGKTTQIPDKRFKGYIEGTYPLRISKVDNCHKRECELIDIFKKKYNVARGREYFKGNINTMIKDFTQFCDSIIPKTIINIVNNYNIDNNNKFKCNICNAEFTAKIGLIKHQNKKNKCNVETAFQCKNCLKYFRHNKSLKEHTIKQNCKNEEHENNDENIIDELDDYLNLVFIAKLDIESKIKLIKTKIQLDGNIIKAIINSNDSTKIKIKILKNNKIC